MDVANFKPYPSRTAYINSLNKQEEVKDNLIDEKCTFCWGSFDPKADPAMRCTSPPIRIPCCRKMYGKGCIMAIASDNKNPESKMCPCCRRRTWTGETFQKLVMEAWWEVIGPSAKPWPFLLDRFLLSTILIFLILPL
jgi:hypothetical protein